MNATKKLFGLLLLISVCVACRQKSPEKLPKFKNKFKAQIASFEDQKEKTDKQVEDGVQTLNGLQEALANARNVDKEFNRIYTQWEKVNKEVEDLNKEYEDLKADAENLFSAMERQTASLADQKTKNELSKAISTTRGDYQKNLNRTAQAISQLRTLHKEAKDAIKALEVAVAIGQVAEFSEGLKNIESRVDAIMSELTITINESKQLYEQRIEGQS